MRVGRPVFLAVCTGKDTLGGGEEVKPAAANGGHHRRWRGSRRGEFDKVFDVLQAGGDPPGSRAAASRNPAIGRDFGERREDEGAQMHAWMRQAQVGCGDPGVVVQQKVEIECAWGVAVVPAAAEAGLDGKQLGE